jgi:glycosidase
MNTIQKAHFITSKLLFFIILCAISSCSKNDNSTTQTSSVNFQVPATEDIVMYEINPSAFSTSKNLQGITNRLSEIKALGVNTIWIMPIYPVGSLKSFGSPYCVKDYTAVNPNFGSLADLKNLVTKAHEKNIVVLLDWVANHTSWDNAWISNYGWYSQDNTGQIISPAGTGWNDVADLNYNNTAMRQAMIDAMKYWVINADIDGYRCDAADFVPYDFWQQANTSLNAIPGKKLIMLAEGSRSDHFSAGFQMNFSWDYSLL